MINKIIQDVLSKTLMLNRTTYKNHTIFILHLAHE